MCGGVPFNALSQCSFSVIRGVAPPVKLMPINHLVKYRSFGPEELKVLATAFDAALLELAVLRTDPAALLVAKRIIALAQEGERDPISTARGCY
jgi:hypothetical protein